MRAGLTIDKLAEAVGVDVKTIRYYQQHKLLDEARYRTGHRRFSAEEEKRVRFIKRALALGFTLDEVGQLLALDQACACIETRELTVRNLALIEEKMAGLTAMRQVLARHIEQCDAGEGRANCAIINALALK